MSAPLYRDDRSADSQRTRRWVVIASISASMLCVGTALAGVVIQVVAPSTLHAWADVGQAFGIWAAVASTAGFALLVFTVLAQREDLRTQQEDLRRQRTALTRVEEHLRCNAEVGLSMFHLNLLEIGIRHPRLASVWPSGDINVSEDLRGTQMYCTLILEGVWLNIRAGRYDSEDARAQLRYFFTSPAFREYWSATKTKRLMAIAENGPEAAFFRLAEEVFREPTS
ncbi:DUF6082 family protein [Dactylosporangium sp. NPDC051541]|uniref:DUF6082 family protein n=1 Tax=Dactylosporangium sp. NPDC051541 TaxID=3363977 RepID=UPI00378F6924